ncbi:DUF2550 domain-containing protein [Brevibacterium album]|uniref:DUF2550 domain-containing protein n=1 Tax=Brevibacterium album TaxID=417948 RepID=UPI0003F63A89|nr:DUF2550 domain-containing protein [Brevibacterium album]
MLASALLITLLSSACAAVVVFVLLSVRRRSLTRAAGAFDCSAESGSRPGTWRLGVAVFGNSSLDWYPVFSLRPHASLALPRSDLEIVSRRAPGTAEQYSMLPDAYVIECRYDVFRGSPKTVRLALDAEALSGFASWLESAPPGANHSMGRFT